MKNFKTLTELQIIKAAYSTILRDLTSEIERNEEYIKKHGKDSIISTNWIDTYTKQLDELNDEIIRIEQSEKA